MIRNLSFKKKLLERLKKNRERGGGQGQIEEEEKTETDFLTRLLPLGSPPLDFCWESVINSFTV